MRFTLLRPTALFVLILTMSTIALTMFTACNREDDIDEIFTGRTWYMNGGKINGMAMNSEVKNFYADSHPSAYSITFSTGTFTGMFRNDAPFSGTWAVDGKKHSITLKFNKKPNITSDFDHHVYNILKGAKSYKSGESFLTLTEDRDNSIMFGSKR